MNQKEDDSNSDDQKSEDKQFQQQEFQRLHQKQKTMKEQMKEEEMDLMSMLKKKKLFQIEKDFQKQDGGLSLEQFVCAMLKHLDYKKVDKKQITLGLIDLFKEIDVNGDQTMEWEEFSNHIIELGLLRKDRTFRNVIKNYYLSENIVDKEKHESDIDNIFYFSNIKNLIVLEKDSPKFKVYNSANCELLCEVNAHKGAVLAAELLPDQNWIATSSNDLTINFWDTSTFNLKQIVSTPEIQLCLKYAEWGNQQKFLYTGGTDAIIHFYDASTLKEKGTMSSWNPFFKKDSQQCGHAGPIGDILPIQSQSTLVTAALDGKICLWDVPTHTFKKELSGHDKGVYSLAWSDYSPMNQFLISAGLDHEAFVWNTYVREKIFLLRGHNHPLVGVKCLSGTPQVITADISGMVKVWDVRNFLCMQNFQVPMNEINSFCLTYPKKRIITASRHLAVYEYDEPKDQLLTDEKQCLRILYADILFSFITLHSDNIKVWDARNGKLVGVHRELSQNELTCCILDNRQRKLFVGDSEGEIFTVNIKNGAKMKEFERHKSIVMDLAYWTSEEVDANSNTIRRLISVSSESKVNFHDEDSSDPQRSCRYTMKQHKGSVNCIAIKDKTELCGTCDDQGNIYVTNLISYRQEYLCRGHPCEIKKLIFLDPYDCLCAADAMGDILFFSLGNTVIKNKHILTKSYQTYSTTNHETEEKFPISAMKFLHQQCYLIMGDEFGNFTIWDLTQLLFKLEKYREHKKKKYQPTMNIKTEQQLQQSPQQQLNSQDLDVQKNSQRNSKQISERGGGQGEQPLLSVQTSENFYLTSVIDQQQKSRRQSRETSSIEREKEKDKEQKQRLSRMLDEENPAKIFSDSDIVKVKQIYKAHQEAITWIELLPQYNVFATSSFDCRCYVWSLSDYQRVGALRLGEDKNWNLNIDVDSRKKQNEEEADELLEDLEKNPEKTYEKMFQEKESDDEKEQTNQPLKQQSKQEKLFGVLHQMEFTQKKKSESDAEEDSDKESKQEEKNLGKKELVVKRAKDLMKRLDQAKEILKGIEDPKKKEFEFAMKFSWTGQAPNKKSDKNLYQEDDEEENDYHILNDLNSYKKDQGMTTSGYTSKTAFKSKLGAKKSFKVKF